MGYAPLTGYEGENQHMIRSPAYNKLAQYFSENLPHINSNIDIRKNHLISAQSMPLGHSPTIVCTMYD